MWQDLEIWIFYAKWRRKLHGEPVVTSIGPELYKVYSIIILNIAKNDYCCGRSIASERQIDDQFFEHLYMEAQLITSVDITRTKCFSFR